MFNTKQILDSSPLRLMLILSVLTSFCLSSRRIIKISSMGVTRENPCNTDVLSTFLPKSLVQSTGFKSDNETHKMCNNLVYSCCDSQMISRLTGDLKLALRYMDARMKHVKHLFQNVTQIAPETIDVFLSELTEKDISCYNKIQTDSLNLMQEAHQNDKEMIERLEKQKHMIEYDANKILENFSDLRKSVDPFIKVLDEGQRFAGEYYSSFICSMCSPEFVKTMQTDRNPQILNLQVKFCIDIIEKRIENFVWKNVYSNTQSIIDLAFCAKKNSKPEKNFGDYTSADISIAKTDPLLVPQYMQKWTDCISDPSKFHQKGGVESDCLNACKKQMNIPEIKMISIDYIMNAENEIYNMFLSTSESLAPEVRVKNAMDKLDILRDLLKEKNILRVGEGKYNYLKMVTPVKDPPIDFSKIQVNISKLEAMSTVANKMDKKYYTGVKLLGMILLISFTALFK